jgi:hypothetical protein
MVDIYGAIFVEGYLYIPVCSAGVVVKLLVFNCNMNIQPNTVKPEIICNYTTPSEKEDRIFRHDWKWNTSVYKFEATSSV